MCGGATATLSGASAPPADPHHAERALPGNTREHAAFFELVQEMGLLPFASEGRDAWLARVRRYERDNECGDRPPHARAVAVTS